MVRLSSLAPSPRSEPAKSPSTGGLGGQYTACKMNCQSRIPAGRSPRPDPGPGSAESALEYQPAFRPGGPRTGSASARPASAPSTIPYTAGPQELCPTPAAPHSAIRRTSVAAVPGANTPPCCGANQAAGDPLDLDQRRAEAARGRPRPGRAGAASAPGGRLARPPRSGGGGSCSNAAASASPLSPGVPGGHRHDAAPGLRHARSGPAAARSPSAPAAGRPRR